MLGGSKKRYAQVGDEVVISIQTAQPRKSVKKKEVHRAFDDIQASIAELQYYLEWLQSQRSNSDAR